jgi:hypothetical protein
MDYRDFDVEIRRSPDGASFAVHVIDAPAGRGADGQLDLPFSLADVEPRLQALQAAILAGTDARRALAGPPPDPIRTTGSELWTALFAGDVGKAFDSSRIRTEADHEGLRLKLRLDRDAAALNQLPWEYLYDESNDAYLAKSTVTPIVRFVEINYPDDTRLVDPPLRILAMAVTPKQLDPLKVDKERQHLERALSRLIDQGLVELKWVEGGTRRDLVRALNDGDWHVFHFIGHGGFDATARNGAGEGVLILVDEDEMPFRIAADDIAGLLGDEMSLRLVVLNSCDGAKGNAIDGFSSTAGAIIRRRTPAVVAMQYEITDRAAREFSRSFYEGIAAGLPIDGAVAQGRDGIAGELDGSLEWGTPVLFTRAPSNVLFRLPATSTVIDKSIRGRIRRWLRTVRWHPAVAGLAGVAAAVAVVALVAAFALGGARRAAINVSAEVVHPGDTMIVTGTNFQHGEPVHVTIQDILLGLATADGNGSFSAPVLIPFELTRSGARSTLMKAVATGRLSAFTAERFVTISPGDGPVATTAPSPPTDDPNATASPDATVGAPPSPPPTAPPSPCIFGFVPRNAFIGDLTCVTPVEQQQVQIDNRLAPIRVNPNGGPYGPDTCVVPYVWRVITPEDHVCVTADERQQVFNDNQLGPTRINLNQQLIIRP